MGYILDLIVVAIIVIVIISIPITSCTINSYQGMSYGMWFFPDFLEDWKLFIVSCDSDAEVIEIPTKFMFIEVKGIDEGVFCNKLMLWDLKTLLKHYKF